MDAAARLPLFAPLLLLAGCGPMADVPGNIPKLGKWEKSVKLVALVANDVWIDRADAPMDLPADKTEIENCIEPALQSKNKLNSSFLANSEKLCTVDTLEHQGATIIGKGTCGPSSRYGGKLTGTMEFNGREKEDRIDATLSMNVNVQDKSGATERVRVGVETKWRRLGDCYK